jgi:TonB-linked SusC/RagA family outer membrane protein
MGCSGLYARPGGSFPTSLAATLLLLVSTNLAWGQGAQFRVTGTVTSATDGSPLPGARVVVKGTDISTLTGANGRYAIDAPSPNDTLSFAFIGYHPVAVAIAGRPVVNATMEAGAVMMEEVVVTGYGTQQRRDVTGAVASLNAEDLTPVPTASVDQTLQGRVAGVQVTPASGKPGDKAIVRIRGVGTLNDASALYVVDGMLTDDVSFLQANDIASVEVLKDASATAIYGSRGANGVIIISTRRGRLERPTSFSVNAYAGSQSVQHRVDLVNGHDYAILANELLENLNPGAPPYFPNPDTIGVGTDWQKALFETAPIQNYQVSSSGGTDKITYYLSGNYFRQAGVVPHSDFNRVTLRLNNDYRLTDHLLFGHNIAVSYATDERPPDVLSVIYRADPTITARNPNGTFVDGNVRSSAGNPAATVFYTRNDESNARVVGNLFGELNLPHNFTFRSSFGLDLGRSQFRSFVPVYSVSPLQKNDVSNVDVETGASSSWLWENTLTYNYQAERHRLNVLAGITAQSFYNENLGCGRTNIPGEDPSLWYCNAGAAVGQTNVNFASDWKMLSYLFRTNYTFKDRYLFTGSLRIDGSSRFGASNRYGYFPSFAVGWNMKEEGFLRDKTLFTALKLRASWGQIGNDKIGAYPGVPIVTGNLNAVFGTGQTLQYGASPIELANPLVKWEKSSQTDIGADMVLFNGQLEATLDYYHRLTDGILVQVPIPNYIGVSTQPFVNAAKVLNTGLEGTFAWRRKFGAADLDLGLNGATISNTVKALGQGNSQILAGGLGNEVAYTTRTTVGQPIGCFWGLKVLGVFQTPAEIASSPNRNVGEQPGDLRFVDTNGDGTITDADKAFLGCPIPDVVYGFNSRLRWGNFDLSATFSGQAGNKVFNGKKAVRFGVENFETSYLKAWTASGTSNWEPRVTTAGNNYVASDRFIEDGSFLKLQNVQLGYRLPAQLTHGLSVEQARIYVSGTNLFTVTNYTGYTPELPGGSVIASGIDTFGGIFPPARTFTVGVDVTF